MSSVRRLPRRLRPEYVPKFKVNEPFPKKQVIRELSGLELLEQAILKTKEQDSIEPLVISNVAELDLSNRLAWTWTTDFSSIRFEGLQSLHLPVFNCSCDLPPNIPQSWFNSLQKFAITCHLQMAKKETAEEEGEGEEEERRKNQKCLPSSVTEFAIYFCHNLVNAVSITQIAKTEDGSIKMPFRAATIKNGDFTALFQAPQNVTTMEFGFAGRKPLIEVFETMRLHHMSYSGPISSLFYNTSGLRSLEKRWIPAFSAVCRWRTNKMPPIMAYSFLKKIEDVYSAQHGRKETVFEMIGSESEWLRAPARYSNTFMLNQMMMRRAGFREKYEIDDSLSELRETERQLVENRTHIPHGGRNETLEERNVRERCERERLRCDLMMENDYGSIDGECGPIQAHERLLRRWVPPAMERTRNLLKTQRFRATDMDTIRALSAVCKRWHNMASAITNNKKDYVVSEAMMQTSGGVRVLEVDKRINLPGGKLIVPVYDRDIVYNRLQGGLFSHGVIGNYEFLCGLSVQVDPMMIIDVERAPHVPTIKEIAFRQAESTSAAVASGIEVPKRAVLVSGICLFGLRIQRPQVSLKCSPTKGEDVMLVKIYKHLKQFAMPEEEKKVEEKKEEEGKKMEEKKEEGKKEKGTKANEMEVDEKNKEGKE